MFKNRDLNKEPFIIAEVGQNHQGDVENALKYVKVFAEAGADAVKFQTRDNKFLFSKESYEASYDSENAFASTYGAHREKLELKKEEILTVQKECKKYGVYFMSTPFDEPSLKFLIDIDCDILKIASFDLGNLPLIDKIGKSKKPVVISVGGGNSSQIKSSVDLLKKNNDEVIILHCVSEYPCPYDRLGLENVKKLKDDFPDCIVGNSDHFNGILSGPVAYMRGARVFEKHVTLNRSWKGTDHNFALEPEGFRKFCRDIRRVTKMMSEKPKNEIGNEPVFKKLGKSLVASKDLKKGDILGFDNLSGKIFKDQIIPVRRSNEIIGKRIKIDTKAGDPIHLDNIE